MDLDDLEPRKQPPRKRNLEPMSIDELEAYIVELEGEIVRVRADIAKKVAHRADAASFFKT